MRQYVRRAPITSMSASDIPIPLPTYDRNPTLHPAPRPLLFWQTLKRPASAPPGRWRAVPQNPPHPGSGPINPRRRRNNWKKMHLRENLRCARTRNRICLEWEVVPKVVSLDRLRCSVWRRNVDRHRFRTGRTSVSSSNRTHVPYFRYFGPTAIVPGFKQMVRTRWIYS